MNKELKPCPFCGNDKLSVGYDDYNNAEIICYGCYARAILYYSFEEAIKKWNTRYNEENDE